MKKINLFKKFLSIFLILIFILNLVLIQNTNAVSTNGSASPWTVDKAEHLAKRILIGVSPQTIQDLYNAGSATLAVNLLFPSILGPDRTSYNAEVEIFKGPTFNTSDTNSMRKLYAFRYYRDPYEAKRKLFGLFEDTFPIDRNGTGTGDINFPDVENHFDVLYSETLGNYKSMVKKVLFDTSKPENSFAMGTYLNLLNQPNKNSPNENYARELMQLFLMLEYKPWEDAENLDAVRNYTETDVASLAKLLTGFRSNDLKSVYFDINYHNTGSTISFLTGALKTGDSFPFYNSSSGTIDNNLIVTSINGNNGLGDNIIDYIFSKRQNEIADFLAWKLIKFYIKDKPTQSEIETIANQIISNNFEIYPVVKSLLASDMMYSDEVMNSIRYKNPLELTIGTLKQLHYKNPQIIDNLINDTSLLINLDWTPYNPRSIFGRDGFDNNANFMNAYFHNQWVTYTSKIAFTIGSGYYDLSDLITITRQTETGNILVKTNTGNTFSGSMSLSGISLTLNEDLLLDSGSTTKNITFDSGSIIFPDFYIETASGKINIEGTLDVGNNSLNISSGTLLYGTGIYTIASSSFTVNSGTSLERDITIDEMITQLEDYLYLGKRLPIIVKDEIKKYLLKTETGADRLFLPNNTNYRNKYIRAVLEMMLVQPEFILQNGYDLNQSSDTSGSNPINDSSKKLVMIELYGGYDWMNGIIPKSDFAYYQNIRGGLAITPDNLIDLGDVYMNKNLEAFKPYFDSGELRIINKVGAPNHSRGHDTAAIQVASQKALQSVGTPGLIGELIKDETNPLNNIVLGTSKPPIYTNGKYINIGGSSILYKNNVSGTTLEKAYQISSLRNVLNSRTFPGNSTPVFKNSIILDDVAKNGQETTGYTLSGKLNFTNNLMNNGLGITYYVGGGGGYDTHGDQLKIGAYNLNDRTRDLSRDITAFFDKVKASGKDVTIVVYSEFGRTLKANGTDGTDHGQGGGYFILTTNNSLKQAIPDKVVGKLSPEKEYYDWFGVGIDYRSIYGKILSNLYNIDVNSYLFGEYKLEDYLNTIIPNPVFLRTEYKNSYSNNMLVDIKFKVEDKNFIFKDGSYIKLYTGTDPNNLKEYSRYTITNNTLQKDNSFKINFNLTKLIKYYYRLEIVDNQYDTYVANGSFVVPDKIIDINKNEISLTTDTYFSKYDNTQVSGIKDISKIVLLNNPVETIVSTGGTNTGAITYSGSLKDISFTGGIIMTFGTGETSISQINSNSGIWNGGFIIPKFINKNEFLSESSVFSGSKLKDLNIENILKVGADSLGVGMNLNQNVKITLPVNSSTGSYKILTSEDGINWNEINGVINSGNTINFNTNHFSYFAVYNVTQIVIIPPVIPPVVPPVIPPVNPPSSGGGGGGGGGGISRDNCLGGDYSPSYYDKSCGTKPIDNIKQEDSIKSVIKDKAYYQNMKKQILLDRLKKKTNNKKIERLKYKGYEILYINGYKLSNLIKSISINIINSRSITKSDKLNYITRLNEYLEVKYNFDSSSVKTRELKSKLSKQEILLKNVLNKLNK